MAACQGVNLCYNKEKRFSSCAGRERAAVQQILLFTSNLKAASALAQSVAHALPLRAVGFRMLPYALAGYTRGELLHFLGAQDPMENDVPCTLRLGRERTVSIPEVWEELAAPTLRRCIPRHAPILMDRLTEAALDCPAFARVLGDCFHGDSPVLALAEESLAPRLDALLGDAAPCVLHWDGSGRERMFAHLVEEISLRL